jgi:hypothetical protein
MGLSHITVVAAIGLAGLLSAGCSKTPPSPQRTQTVAANDTVTYSKKKNLGVIQMTNHYETEIDLGKGKSCTIIPRLLDQNDLRLTLTFGSKSADGRPTGLCVTQVTARPGQPFVINVNDVDMSFTPRLVE